MLQEFGSAEQEKTMCHASCGEAAVFSAVDQAPKLCDIHTVAMPL
jgi:hypothetical protein